MSPISVVEGAIHSKKNRDPPLMENPDEWFEVRIEVAKAILAIGLLVSLIADEGTRACSKGTTDEGSLGSVTGLVADDATHSSATKASDNGSLLGVVASWVLTIAKAKSNKSGREGRDDGFHGIGSYGPTMSGVLHESRLFFDRRFFEWDPGC